MKIKEVIKVIGGTLRQGNADARLGSVSIDTRRIKAGDVFIAIQGSRFDGHRFINSAIQKKASALILSKKVKHIKTDIPIIYVKDTTRALGLIAQAHRKQFSIPIIAVTGSTGKTTTKDMIASILKVKYSVLKSQSSQNNHIGLPLTLLKLRKHHQVAVVELGTNQRGDIRWLTQIAQPDVAVYTNIGESHLQLLKTPLGVLKEKSDLVKHMQPKGTVIINNDDPLLKKIKMINGKRKLVRYSIKTPSRYRATKITPINNRRTQFLVNQRYRFDLNTPAVHNVYNALASISCGRLFKIRYNDIQAQLKRIHWPKGRMEIKKVGAYWVIDDTYNANPLSFQSALRTLSQLQTRGRRILVCGDMLELGTKTVDLHQRVGRQALGSNINLVLTYGRLAKQVAHTVNQSQNGLKAFPFQDLSGLHQKLKKYCQPGDAILVKASRGMSMDRTVDFLLKSLS